MIISPVVHLRNDKNLKYHKLVKYVNTFVLNFILYKIYEINILLCFQRILNHTRVSLINICIEFYTVFHMST